MPIELKAETLPNVDRQSQDAQICARGTGQHRASLPQCRSFLRHRIHAAKTVVAGGGDRWGIGAGRCG